MQTKDMLAIFDAELARLEALDHDGYNLRFRVHTVKDLLAADLTVRWDVDGMLMRQTYGVDAGELKTLKTHVGTARMVGLAGGISVMNTWRVPERRRVLTFVAEGGRVAYIRRLRRICEAHGIELPYLHDWLFTIFDSTAFGTPEFESMFAHHVSHYQPAFVHLDPLYAFQPTNVSSRILAQMGEMLVRPQEICARNDATLWLTAHFNQTGSGLGLKRITGAGVGEWADSFVLLEHRVPPDVPGGRFKLGMQIGSRQWGGANYDVDFNIGKFDTLTNTHDGPITFDVRPQDTTEEQIDKRTQLELRARNTVLSVMRRAKTPIPKTEIVERCADIGKTPARAVVSLMIDDETLVQVSEYKPPTGGRTAPLYELHKDLKNQ